MGIRGTAIPSCIWMASIFCVGVTGQRAHNWATVTERTVRRRDAHLAEGAVVLVWGQVEGLKRLPMMTVRIKRGRPAKGRFVECSSVPVILQVGNSLQPHIGHPTKSWSSFYSGKKQEVPVEWFQWCRRIDDWGRQRTDSCSRNGGSSDLQLASLKSGLFAIEFVRSCCTGEAFPISDSRRSPHNALTFPIPTEQWLSAFRRAGGAYSWGHWNAKYLNSQNLFDKGLHGLQLLVLRLSSTTSM